MIIDANTELAKNLITLAEYCAGKKGFSTKLADKNWYITISCAANGTATTALCEAEGSPSAAQIFICLEELEERMMAAGQWKLGYIKSRRCPQPLNEVFDAARTALKNFASSGE